MTPISTRKRWLLAMSLRFSLARRRLLPHPVPSFNGAGNLPELLLVVLFIWFAVGLGGLVCSVIMAKDPTGSLALARWIRFLACGELGLGAAIALGLFAIALVDSHLTWLDRNQAALDAEIRRIAVAQERRDIEKSAGPLKRSKRAHRL